MVTCEPCQGYATVKQRDKPPQNESFTQRQKYLTRHLAVTVIITIHVAQNIEDDILGDMNSDDDRTIFWATSILVIPAINH